ncbi:hypothetical protein [Pseudomonas sp. McL0111]|uniref:hypothetical protein n=1 Tax=Pseudomonas sp. McL0111 TaxID=3457357 RepID=UPI00403ED7AD
MGVSGGFVEPLLPEQQLLEQQCRVHAGIYKGCWLFRKRTLIDIYILFMNMRF